MSDDDKAVNMTGASGAGWSEKEKIAYLIMLCENEGRLEAKISVSLALCLALTRTSTNSLLQNAPIPVGRSVIACKMMIIRLKEKYKEEIMKIKSGQPLDVDTNGETPTLPEPKTPRKRKSKAADGDADTAAGEDSSPKKKKPTPRKSKTSVTMEEPVKMEETVKEEGEEYDSV